MFQFGYLLIVGIFFSACLFLKPCEQMNYCALQVDHLEVVNKQYVKVIPAHGVNSSEVVSCMKMLSCPLTFHIL